MNEKLSSIGLLILRIGLAGAMLPHAFSKVSLALNGNSANFLNPLGIGSATSLYLSLFAELICSLLIAFGIFTRLAATVLAVNMCVAILYWINGGQGWNAQMELPTLYLIGYVAIIFCGAGKYSLDDFRSRLL